MTAAAPAPTPANPAADATASPRSRGTDERLLTTDGRLSAAIFSMPIRVYYEDTDAGGIVYYANWLRFFERARTDWLRTLGAQHRRLADESGVLLVVRAIAIDYRQPARLDDELIVDVRPIATRRASCELWQSARLAGEDASLVVAKLRIAAIRRTDGRPTAFPKWLHERLCASADAASSDESR